jgi:hypothetical protein
MVSAEEDFIDAIKGDLNVNATDLIGPYNTLAHYFNLPSLSGEPPIPNPLITTSKIDVVMFFGEGALVWNPDRISHAHAKIQVGFKVYICSINYYLYADF